MQKKKILEACGYIHSWPCPAVWGEINSVHESITIQLLSVLDLLEQSIKENQMPQNNICPNFLSFLQGS